MRIAASSILVAAGLTIASNAALAQIDATGPVVNGHHHLNVSDVDAHRRFWIDTLGGTADTFGSGTAIAKFPDALVFLREQVPTGGSIGSTVDHVGFSVPDLREVVDRLVAAGYDMVTAEASPPGSEIVDDIRIIPGGGPVSGLAFVIGPDDIKVEVLEMPAQEVPIRSHHIHFFGDEAEAMQAWYGEVFGASVRPGAATGFFVATLPGLSMNYTPTDTATSGTAGRVIDHIGFEIDGLKAFVEGLEASGIEFDVPYREVPAAGLAIAFFTDPWGTYIELSEGLDNIR